MKPWFSSMILGMTAVLMAMVLLLISFVVQARRPVPFFQALDVSQPIPVFISSEGSGYRSGDNILAELALAAWEKAANGAIEFEPSEEDQALLRLYWVSSRQGRYGEMRPIRVGDRRGAAIFVRPELLGLGQEISDLAQEDQLFRDTIVYLTCVHELGHGLGLEHTANDQDIMFFFGYGGDVLNYFQRYRNQLEVRGDIAEHWGLSDADITTLRGLYP
jgi:hypothetical protein